MKAELSLQAPGRAPRRVHPAGDPAGVRVL